MSMFPSTIRMWSGFFALALAGGVRASAPLATESEGADRKPETEAGTISEARPLPVQFDLVCEENWRTVNDPRGYQRPATTPPGGWDFADRNRYRIDLEAMRYCGASACAEYRHQKIASWNADRIVLDDETHGRSWTFFMVDRHEATIEMRITGDDGFMRLLTGVCRYEPFSGFPTDRDSRRVRGTSD